MYLNVVFKSRICNVRRIEFYHQGKNQNITTKNSYQFCIFQTNMQSTIKVITIIN